MIFGQDKTFGPYDEDLYVKTLMDLNQKYPGAGTQIPMQSPQQWYSATYYWPEATPLSPIGNSHLTGIIAGQVYDPATPYICTQVRYLFVIMPNSDAMKKHPLRVL